MKSRAQNKILAFALAAVMLFTLLPGVTVRAEAEEGGDSGAALGDSGVITAFGALTEGVASQSVPLGTSMSALTLPDVLDAEVDGVPDSIPVGEWQSSPEYDDDIEGTYIFTPVISDEYTLEVGVALPVITVTVEEGGEAAQAITLAIAEDEYGETALYLPRGVTIAEADLLAGVSAADENGNSVPVTITDMDGLDTQNPQMKSEGYPNPPYIISYMAAHPDNAEVTAIQTREVYVTLGAEDMMPMNLNTDLEVGTWTGYGHRWVEFGGILWRVLEVKDNDSEAGGNKTALLLAENSVGNRQFHTTYNSGDNDWNSSDIKAWLNNEVCTKNDNDYTADGFLNRFDDDAQAAIVISNYTYGGPYSGSNTQASSKVFLLSVDEAGSYFANDADRSIGAYWWLRSPGPSGDFAAFVFDDGYVYADGINVNSTRAIRPALKINLASSIFTSKNPLYETKVTVEDGGSLVAGARVTFSGASAPDAKFSDSAGVVTVLLPAGSHDFTVTKPGYANHSGNVNVTAPSGGSVTIQLTADTTIPDIIHFGSFGGDPLQWLVLDIDQSGGKALLLANSRLKQDTFPNVGDWIKDGTNGGFLYPGTYFTQEELDAMETTGGEKMFLLNQNDVQIYLPDGAMRVFPSGGGVRWWIVSSTGSYYAITNDTGNFSNPGTPYSNHDARPAVWVDLTKLVQKDDGGTITLVPTASSPATITVKENWGSQDPIAGAAITITSGGGSFRPPNGELLTDNNGEATIGLPEGTYSITVTKDGYDDGSGTLTVSGSGGTATIMLTAANTPPTFTLQPIDQTTTEGNNATFTAAASGNPAPAYQWQLSTNGGSAWNDISGETGGTLTLTGVTTAMNGYKYRCKATNTEDTAYSDAATLTVTTASTPPTFTLQPIDQTTTEGDNAIFTAAASGNPAPAYQWQLSTNDGNTWNDIGGATSGTLTLTGVTTAMTGNKYRCAAENIVNTAYSNAATLTVNKQTNNGGGSSSSSSSDRYTPPAYAYGNITVYGVNVSYSIENATGILTLNLTSDTLNKILNAADGNKAIAVGVGNPSGLKGLDISFPPSWFVIHEDVTFAIQSGIGGVHLNSNAAKIFPAQSTTGTFSLRKGSLTLSARQSGKAVTWNTASAPVIVYMPYTPKEGAYTNALVLYNKATGAVAAHSFYSGGKVYGAVNRPGEYDVKAVAVSFTDITNHWAKDDIAFAASHGLISGTSGTAFSPDTDITRADFLMALGKLAGSDVSGYKQSSFTDVSNDSAAMPYIEWAYKNGIAQGNGDGTFGPGRQITREQMAVMIVSCAKVTGHTLPVIRQAVTFADNVKISAWAKDAVKAVQQAGIITGKPNNLFDPQGSATRAEASAILRRFAESAVNGRLGWVQNDKGEWLYIKTDYTPKTGWLTTTEGSKYWFDDKGIRASGKWVQIDGKWYYFGTDGKLAVNTTIDGYEVGADDARKEK